MTRITWSLLMFMFLGVQALKSQTVPVGTGESIRLSGSNLKPEDIISKTDAIFVGKIEEIGLPSTAQPGDTYMGVQVEVSQVLRGSVDDKISVTFYVASDFHVHEQAPKAGSAYIFFLQKVPGWNIVLKLLPATDENIAKVKALIAAAPASK